MTNSWSRQPIVSCTKTPKVLFSTNLSPPDRTDPDETVDTADVGSWLDCAEVTWASRVKYCTPNEVAAVSSEVGSNDAVKL